jgi:hypothetical protein
MKKGRDRFLKDPNPCRSASTAFVSHEYTAHADHSAVSSAAPCQHPDPREVVFEEAGYLGEGEDRVEE